MSHSVPTRRSSDLDVYPDDFLPLGLKDLGFEQYPTKLFVALLPNAIVLVLSVFQLRMFNGEHWTKVTTRHDRTHDGMKLISILDVDRKSTRLNSSHKCAPRIPSSA